MPFPIVPALVLAGLSAVALSKRESETMRMIQAKRKQVIQSAGIAPGALKTFEEMAMEAAMHAGQPRPGNTPSGVPSGVLPAQAIAALNAGKWTKTGPNNLHRRDAWFYFGDYSDHWFEKRGKVRFYASPPGALYVKSVTHHRNLAWFCRARASWQPGYGRAQYKNVRLPGIKHWLGPKADWDTFTGVFKDSLAAIPEVVNAAGIVVEGIYSGGASMMDEPGEQIDTVIGGIGAALEPIGDTGSSITKRKKAAAVVVSQILNGYVRQMKDANPHAVRPDGILDTSARYMRNPQTWADLRRPGDARPLLYNPR